MNNQTITKSDFVNVIPILKKGLKYWYVFILTGIFCMACAVIYYKMTKPVYQIDANILIKQEDNSSMGGLQAAMLRNSSFGSLLGIGASSSVYDELELINSFTTFKETVKELNLNNLHRRKLFLETEVYYKNSPIVLTPIINIADTLETTIQFKINIKLNGSGTIKAYTGILKKIGETKFEKFPAQIRTDYGDFIINTTQFYIPQESYNLKVSFSGYNATAESLQKDLKIDIKTKKANIFNLTIPETNRIKGKDILNTLIRIYSEKGIYEQRRIAANTITFLDERIDIISKELFDVEKSLEIYKETNNLTNIDAEAKAILDQGSEFRKQQIEIETQYAVIGMIEDFMKSPDNQYALIPLNIGLNDRTAIEGLQQYNDALLERMKLLKSTHINNPIIEIQNEQINAMRTNMLATIETLKAGYAFTRKDLKTQEDYFNSRLKGMPKQEREYVNIKRQQYIKQELFMYLLRSKEENSLTLSINTPKIQIVDNAYNFNKPIKPRLLSALIIALGFAFIMSIGEIKWIESRKKMKEINEQ